MQEPTRHLRALPAILVVTIALTALLLTSVTTASASSGTTDDFAVAPVLAASQTPGAWYPDRKAPAVFDGQFFDGDSRLHIGIDGAARDLANNFYNTQGRKFDVETGDGLSMSGDLYIGADWETQNRRSDLWATAFDANGDVSGYPIIGFITGTGFRCFTQQGWVNVGYPAGFTYGRWYHLKVEVVGSEFRFYIDGQQVAAESQTYGTTRLGNIMVQAYNFGQNYDVYWDNISPGPKVKPVTVGAGAWAAPLPEPAVAVEATRPPVSVRVSDPLGLYGNPYFQLKVDGVRWIPQAKRVDTSTFDLVFTPRSDLAPGRHTVWFSAMNLSGKWSTATWYFNVE